jgi:hypothetical protein
MRLAILLWFYKDPGICENCRKLLRKYNPEASIYGLYSGNVSQKRFYADKLRAYLDDFYCFEANAELDWKWRLVTRLGARPNCSSARK